MVKSMLLILVAQLIALSMLLVAVTQQAHADSLVCQHRGQFLTYTEVTEEYDMFGVKSVVISQIYSSVRFYNGKEYRYGSIIPCVMIKEDIGKTKFLKEYLAQFE